MFQGFSAQTIDFLWGIRFNNERSWFLEHKPEYEQALYQPLKELAAQVSGRMAERHPELGLISKVARIYRDVRRLYHGGPYKDHLWFTIRQPAEDWTAKPAFYFEVYPEGWEYGMGYYCVRPVQMEAYRRRILREPQALERLAFDLARQGEFVLEGEEYKRPKGQVSPLLQPWFQKKSITLCCAREPDGLFTSPELADFLADAFERLMPYYDYFRALELEPVPEN